MSFYSIAPFIQEYYPQYYSIETYPAAQCVTIHKVAENWGLFSNFAQTPIVLHEVTFRSAEQLFQLMKFKDEEPVRAVFQARNPKMTAKKWEKKYRRSDWGSMIVDAMKFCIQLKYEQHETFRKLLEESKDKYIVEDQTSFPKKTPDTWGTKLREDQYTGPNLLGRLLMELREYKKLDYHLPADALSFVFLLKNNTLCHLKNK
jgi:ribA/ribD-fused uncharacterized protein